MNEELVITQDSARETRECVQELFERQAARRPDAVAIIFEGERVTYDELNARANRLAHHLRSLGVGPDVIVGLMLNRSTEMLVALLGILKAGGAYLPLDPAYPVERLAFMLDDAGASLVVTEEALLEQLPSSAVHVVSLDGDDRDTIDAEPADNPEPMATTDNLAYVIYTSGSTGTPKGVAVAHRGLLNMARAQGLAFGAGEESRVLQFASISFDASIFEIVMSFAAGASLCVARREELLPGDSLLKTLSEHAVTHATLPPSALSALPDAALPRLQVIVAAGEEVRAELVRRWAPGRRFFNAYGPTETTVWASVAECSDHGRKPHIGRAIPNVQMWVLDSHMNPPPFGVAGELYVGGAGLARGYVNRPALTADRFIPDPFSAVPGARLYRTGDAARVLADGEIEFVGRLDRQLKIRGYRIEPAEIEEALASHRSVREAAVVAREDETGATRLVAYVTPRDGDAPGVEQLRGHLQERLPEYMLPHVFVTLDELPLTPAGKVDRAALPAPDAGRPRGKEYVPPRDAAEQFVSDMWRESLGVEAVGADDHFFELGGDSIEGAIFVNRLQETLDEVVQVIAIFSAPTVAAFAAYLKEHHAEALARVVRDEPTVEHAREAGVDESEGVDESKVALMRRIIKPLPPRPLADDGAKNPQAVFILSPPRCGSTLLRVMLAGHTQLFAPPELELLGFNTLEERRSAFTGAASFWLEGTVRAVMELKGRDADEAKEIMRGFEEQRLTTKQFYRAMQDWLGARRLVDKTPAYSLDASVLQRAEEDFDRPLYIHLLRHPSAMIPSFMENKGELFFRYEQPFTPRELAELVWIVSNQNILEHLARIPEERQHRVRFEDLVGRPSEVLEDLCRFLGVELQPGMLRPYDDRKSRMTDGLYEASRMLGDVKFLRHSKIDAGAAERWKTAETEDSLGRPTRELAARLGYIIGPHSNDETRTEAVAVRRVTREAGAGLPLSYAQQRLWFIEQLQPNSHLYNQPVALRLRGPLNVAALGETFNEIVRRHEVLRTTFEVRGQEPVQVIRPAETFDLPVVDLSGLEPSEREARLRSTADAEARRPFDLGAEPPLRALLLRLSAGEHVLLFTMHHIAADGWSIGVLIREVSALYAAFAAGRPVPLAEPPIQYADYAVWQREWLTPERLEGLLAFWREELRDAPPLLELPTDRPRTAPRRHEGAQVTFNVGAELGRRLRELGRENGVTLFMLLLAAYKVLLMRYSNQEEIVVGTDVANRNRKETEGLVGFFVNMLALRTPLAGDPSFAELLGRVREVSLRAFEHQELPFEKLVEELEPERSLTHTPLFQAVFVLQNAHAERLHLPGVEATPLETRSLASRFDVVLAMREAGEEIEGLLEYDAELFDAATVERMAGHFINLLESIVAEPHGRVSQLNMLSDGERRQLLVEWNDTSSTQTTENCLHELFEQQAARTPDAVAVAFNDERLTYSELNARSNRLAHHLRSLGVGPDVVVGLMLNRSPRMLVALLGVLKTGGAYLPLDPAYPVERLAFMLDDAGAAVLLTEGVLLERLPSFAGPVVSFDDGWDEAEGASSDNLDAGTTPDNLAYVIYTSGSTGTPKGVMVRHGGVTNLFAACERVFNLGPDSRVVQFASFTFDASVMDIVISLLSGAALYLAPRDSSLSAADLPALMREHEITHAVLPTSVVAASGGEEFPHLKELMVAGEACPPEVAARLAPGRRFINGYGPTETTVCATAHEYEPNDRHTVPIGRPILNTRVYVLNRFMQPVPLGVAGELYVGGAGLARGYAGRPALTADRFIPDPFSAAPGARLYRTGDRVRYMAEGEIEFLGRIDNQVKLNGYRIEPGEIEAALTRHPAVGEAVVLTRDESRGPRRLVAYVVPDPRRSFFITDAELYRLPNGLRVAHLSKNDTDVLYREIFEEQDYFRHGISVNDGDCVFDVGANLGMFTLFVAGRCPGARVYAFEPVPPIYEKLRANVALYDLNVKLFNFGLSDRGRTATLTFYPGVSGMSGAYADAEEDARLMRRHLSNRDALMGEFADELSAGRFASETFERELRTLSEVLRDENVSRVDLLKVDVEKAERDVLLGIEEEDWKKIMQVVVEVHDLDGRLRELTGLLERQGFEVTSRQEEFLKGTEVHQLYATRYTRAERERREREARAVEPGLALQKTLVTTDALRDFLKERLPEYMLPSAFVALQEMPLTSSGKVDRRALPAPSVERPKADGGFVAPRTAVEKLLAEIWSELTGVERIGTGDNFFEIGGHSLLATRFVVHAREILRLDIPVQYVFDKPTLAGLAAAVEELQRSGAETDTSRIVPVARQAYRVKDSSADER